MNTCLGQNLNQFRNEYSPFQPPPLKKKKNRRSHLDTESRYIYGGTQSLNGNIIKVQYVMRSIFAYCINYKNFTDA